jgi:hypothetical protein
MGRRRISIFPMTPAQRKARQREREKAKRDQAAFAFNRLQEIPPHIVTAQVTKQASYSVTSNVTISTPAALTCFCCGRNPDAAEYMIVVRGELALCDKCAGDKDFAGEFEQVAFAVIDLFEAQLRPIKIQIEQFVEKIETHRRNGLVPEAEQAFSIRAQQRLEAALAALDAIEKELEP